MQEEQPEKRFETIGLSQGQQALWSLCRLAPDSGAYNINYAWRLNQPLDPGLFRSVLQALAERLPSWRGLFVEVEGIPQRRIFTHIEIPFFEIDGRGWSTSDLDLYLRRICFKPFYLDREPPIRWTLIQTMDSQVLLMQQHHLASDVWSVMIILNQIRELYQAAVEGRPFPEPVGGSTFSDYLQWQQDHLHSKRGQKVAEFWKNELAGPPAPLDLPLDFPRRSGLTYGGDFIYQRLPDSLAAQLFACASRHQLFPVVVALAAFQLLLARYGNCAEVCTGVATAGRRSAFARLVDYFINPVVVRSQVVSDLSFDALVQEVGGTFFNALKNQDHPFSLIVQDLAGMRDPSRSPLFDVQLLWEDPNSFENKDTPMVYLDQSGKEVWDMYGMQWERLIIKPQVDGFDLTLRMIRIEDALFVLFDYSDLFEAGTIRRLASHFTCLLQSALGSPDEVLSRLSMADDGEKQLLLSFDATTWPFPETTVLTDFLKQRAQTEPELPALVSGNQTLSYAQLFQDSQNLAGQLILAGAGPGDVVAIHVARSIPMMTAIFAVLQAGCVYLPLDPAYPEERLSFMLQDSNAVALLSSGGLHHRFTFSGPCLDPANVQTGALPLPEITSSYPAYLIYTSGSTGRPKGVLVSHRAAVNRIHWMQRLFPLSPSDCLLQKTPISFDVSVWELLWWTMAGARLCMLAVGGEKDPQTQIATMKRSGVTTLHFVPSMLAVFLDFVERHPQLVPDLSPLKRVFTSGEALGPGLANRFHRTLPQVGLVNLYGPTEACVDVTWFDCRNQETHTRIPIGRAIDNCLIYIMDRELQQQAIGIPGELLIGGTGLAFGYRGRPSLTAERFVPNPLATMADGGSRLYRTGDLARILADGQVLFLGRLDFQVKLRGFRIELSEIEARLLAIDGVDQACVQIFNEMPAAWYSGPAPLSAGVLRDRLSLFLPDYMVPVWYTFVAQMPLSPSGKLDRRALPEPEVDRNQNIRQEPRDFIEKELAVMWQQCLKVENPGINDNFFSLGGHSLMAVGLGARIIERFRVDVSLAQLLANPTIKQMRAYIQGAGHSSRQPMVPAADRLHWPLSPAQRRMYLFDQIKGPNIVYNLPALLGISGPLDLNRLAGALEKLVQRHEMLRTTFSGVSGQLSFVIHTSGPVEILEEGISDCELKDRIRAFIRPFDLAKGPLIRALVLHLGPDRHQLLIDMHHIVADEVSHKLILEDLLAIYEGRSLKQLRFSYKDYAVWHIQRIHSGQLEEDLQFFLKRLTGELPILDLPHDLPRSPEPGLVAGEELFFLDAVQTSAIDSLAQSQQVTTTMLLLACFQTWLALYSGQEDIITGLPADGRPVEAEGIVGLFANTLAIRSYPTSNKTFVQLLEEVAGELVASFDCGEVPFDSIVDALPPAPRGRHPVFDAFFVLQDREPGFLTSEISARVQYINIYEAKFDLLLGGRREGDCLGFGLRYRSDLFSQARVRQMADHFVYLLQQLTRKPGICLGELEKVCPAEKARLLFGFNQTDVDLPADQTIISLFEDQVSLFPKKTALIYGDRSMSYQELALSAGALADRLQQRGIQKGDFVALSCDRGLSMIVGIFGILTAGAAYLPLDPATPPERMDFILADSNCRLLVWGEGPRPETKVPLIDLESQVRVEPMGRPKILPEHPAYIIYTSGSTGQPKGVVVCHRNLVNLRIFFQRDLAIDSQINSIQFAPFTFDASAGEIFMSLLLGCTLHLLPMSVIANPDKFQDYLVDNQIGFAAFPPAYLAMLDPQRLRCLKKVMTAGSSPDADLPRRWSQTTDYINGYGPTETTIISTAWQRQNGPVRDHHIPIGRPVANTRIYLLDDLNRLVPTGAPGQLCIAGSGLSLGYLNRPKLNAEFFVENPYIPGEIIYKTGDLARYLDEKGHLEFVGRRDQQVKIRGFRIELGEIEFHLKAHPEVRACAVIDRTDSLGNRYLCGYIVGQLEHPEQWLAGRLPGYMIPNFFVKLDSLPLTTNGKLDRNALPEPQRSELESDPPQTGTERLLAPLWQQVLGLEQVSRQDNFFEVGGQSLKAMELVSRIGQILNKSIAIVDLFESPVFWKLALLLDSPQHKPLLPPLTPTRIRDIYPLSPAQNRLWVLERMEGSGTGYLMPMTLHLCGTLEIGQLECALERLQARNQALRTDFVEVDWAPFQRVHDKVSIPLEYRTMAGVVLSELDQEKLLADYLTPFSLDQAPLMRAALIRLSPTEHLLLLVVHHLIADGLSLARIVGELFGQNPELPASDLDYIDYSDWYHQLLEQGVLDKQRQFWKQIFACPVPPVTWGRSRIENASFSGAIYRKVVSPALVSELKILARREQMSLYMTMLAGTFILLARCCGNEDLVIGTPVAGRPIPELEPIIGLFTNTLALRAHPRADLSLLDFLRDVRQMCLQAFENADYPYDKLIEDLHQESGRERNPLFDIMFLFQPASLPDFSVGNLKIQGLASHYPVSQFRLTFEIEQMEDQLSVGLLYQTQAFPPGEVQKLADDYLLVLEQMTAKSGIPIGISEGGKIDNPPSTGFEDVDFDF